MIAKIFVHNNHQFLVVNNERNLEITFCCYGASVYAVKYKHNYVTYHPESLDEFLHSSGYYGKTLGRTCGRIKDGVLSLNGQNYQLDKNDHGNTLHGGKDGLSFKDFAYEVSENNNEIKIIFIYKSPAGEGGYPGNAVFRVSYHVSKKKDAFLIHYLVTVDRATPINLSTHIYWRLTGKDVLNHELYVHAKKRVLGDKHLLNVRDVSLTDLMDFSKPKIIGQGILDIAQSEPVANGLDHSFVFPSTDRSQVIVRHNHIKLSVKTDMNVANIFTNNYPKYNQIMKQYGEDVVYGGIALEPQMHFLSYNDIITDPEHPYEHSIAFVLEEDK
ncbi:MAG: hypothetical protein MJ207_02435 [Bacilli bacterium]|nr:hypothetical protein [Bacilli bacterium]